MLVSYASDNEIDGTLEDYMKIIVDISYLCFFGLSLPLSFLLAFLGGILHLHLVKWKLLFLVKRPVPLKTDSIGFWKVIIETISLTGVIINTFYIMYTRKAFDEGQAIGFFLFLLISFVLVRYIFSSTHNTSQNRFFLEFVDRHENNLRKVILKAKNENIKSTLTQGLHRACLRAQDTEQRDDEFNEVIDRFQIHRHQMALPSRASHPSLQAKSKFIFKK